MSPADWARVKDLFDAALLLPPADRGAFVNSQTKDDEVLAELRSLLEVYEQSPEFLDRDESHALEGRKIGPWRLLREIGRGGMGVVWEAVRDDQEYQQRAAIKLLPAGFLSSADIARFREERQILARLAHPGIARLLDGGTMDDGSPYLVMEYIEGERLDVWAQQHAPSLRERLRLFLSICAAVDYAHRHLVVHRDLKPANILVTPDRDACLLDFGIAKLLDTDDGAVRGSAKTVRRLTPEYASPEQIRGDAVSTGSDIYSLGVVLYRLLAGRSPYSADPEDTLGTMDAICNQDPAAPSTVAADDARELRGELDAIVLEALCKNPEQRYASARRLADDIEAWLDGRPVTAHKQPWWIRAVRHVRRHKTQSAAAAAVLLSIVTGSVVSLWYARDAEHQREIAEVRFQEGRKLAHAVVFDLYEAIAHLQGSTRARQILVDRALRYLRELEASGPASRDLQMELAAAYARIGDVLGNPTQAHLGSTVSAIDSETQARRLALAVLRSHPGDTDAEAILAEADERLFGLNEQQGLQANDILQEAMDIRRREAAAKPGDLEVAARVRTMEAARLSLQQQWPDALAAYQQVAAMYQQLVSQNPRNFGLGDRLSTTYHHIARCWKELNRLDEALAAYEQAKRLDQGRFTLSPGDTDAETDLSFDLVEAGWIEYRLGKYKQAIADYERAFEIQERLGANDPQDIRMRLEAAKLLNTAAPAYEAAGERARAIQILKTAAERLEDALASDPDNEDTRLHVGWVWSNLGAVYERAADWGAAEPCYRRTLEIMSRLQGSGRLDLDIDPKPIVARATAGLASCRKHLD
ncbi:MAG TPA: serine/threonine-protein kinase [Bryobacteraceae bacterium]|nr:serine/threonine-protein kinase [Bryobacteraceae bacterium]